MSVEAPDTHMSGVAEGNWDILPRKYEPNQLFREFLSINGLNPYDGYDSSSRKQMFSSHLGQALVIKGATRRRIQTGMEREYAKYTFGVRMPEDGQVLKVIDRYPTANAFNAIRMNPQSVMIYEEYGTNRIGVLNMPRYCSYHQYFGFELKYDKNLKQQLRRGQAFAKDTVFAQTPNIDDNGDYTYGIQLNMCLMTHPAVSEDGVMICRDVLPRLAYKTYERRTVSFGTKRFPVNAYGSRTEYKPFPDIGDYIHESGLIMALRSYNKELAPVDQSIDDLLEVDHFFDECTYSVPGKGRVVDIIIHHDENSLNPCTPLGMEAQAKKYDTATKQFFKAILGEYNDLRKSRKDNLELTPQMQSLVREAISVVGDHKEAIQKLNRQVPMDDWTITFVIEYENIPDVGNKMTDCHGGKGVIVHVAEPHEMPYDPVTGKRADVVMDPLSTWGRMNTGRLYEQFTNAAGDHVQKTVCEILGFTPGQKGLEPQLTKMMRDQPAIFHSAWSYLIEFYRTCSPVQASWFDDGSYGLTPAYHMAQVIENNTTIFSPPENDREGLDIVADIILKYRPHLGPVTYTGYSGRQVTTKMPMRIAEMYFIVLEKTGDDWTAVGSGKVQHFGVLSQVSGIDKYALPTRQNPTRTLGEAELRILEAYLGGEVVAEMMDRNNNPLAHRHIVEEILTADVPTNIERIVDRVKIPFGGSKPLQLVKHLLEGAGLRFVLKAWDYAKKPFNFPRKSK